MVEKNIDDLENFKNIDASMFSSMFWHLYRARDSRLHRTKFFKLNVNKIECEVSLFE